MTARERFHAAVLERAAELGAPAAAEWIGGHGLLAICRHPELDERVRDLLRPRLRYTAATNMLLVARFREVVDSLAGIPVCPVKGIHLLEAVYREDPESRVLGDLDLLVPPERLDEAVARLAAVGFEENPVSWRIQEVSPQRLLSDGRVVVELHDRLAIKHIGRSTWEEAEPKPGRLHGWEVHLLDRETTLVHLVCHLVKHRPFSRLGWVEDVLRWIELGVDGESALERAWELGALTAFVAGVRALRQGIGPVGLTAVPELPRDAAGRLAVRLNERLVWRDLGTGRWGGGAGSSLGRTLSALLLADRAADRGRFLRAKLAELWRR